jgi:hypothetical protein
VYNLEWSVYFMYVDESGDPGTLSLNAIAQQPSRHYILSALIIPAREWRLYLSSMVAIRRTLRQRYGLPIRTEQHGVELIHPRGNPFYKQMRGRHQRVALYRDVLQSVCSQLPAATIINVHLDKAHLHYSSAATVRDIQTLSWSTLIRSYDTFLQRQGKGMPGLIFADEMNEVKIRRLMRQLRVHDFNSNRSSNTYSARALNVVEDPVMRSSQHSYFVQIADLVAHALYRKLYPKGSYRQFNVDKLFDYVNPLLLRAASNSDPQGIIHL